MSFFLSQILLQDTMSPSAVTSSKVSLSRHIFSDLPCFQRPSHKLKIITDLNIKCIKYTEENITNLFDLGVWR